MGVLRQYAIDGVEFTWNGLDFKPGFAATTFVTITSNVPTSTYKPTANGGGVRVFNVDRSKGLVVTVDQESTLHQQLLAVMNQDRQTRDQVADGKLNDTSSGEVWNLNKMFIAGDPDISRGIESTTFDWTFVVQEGIPVPNELNATNLVG